MALLDLQGMDPTTRNGKEKPDRSGASKQCEGGGGGGNHSSISLACLFDGVL